MRNPVTNIACTTFPSRSVGVPDCKLKNPVTSVVASTTLSLPVGVSDCKMKKPVNINAGMTFPSPVGEVTILSKLGSGSFATVWRAITPNKEYAVKILAKHKLDARQLQIQALEHTLHAQVCYYRHPVVTL